MFQIIRTAKKLSGPSNEQLRAYALYLLSKAADNHAAQSDLYRTEADVHFYAILDNCEDEKAYDYFSNLARFHRENADYFNGQYSVVALMSIADFMSYQETYAAWLNGLHIELKGN